MKLDRVWVKDLASFSNAVVPLLLSQLSKQLTTILVLLALLESPNILDLLLAVDNKDDIKAESLLRLDFDDFVERSTGVGLLSST